MKMLTDDLQLERSQCSYKNCSERYVFQRKRKFDLQYAQLYTTRFKLMKGELIQAAKKKWGDDAYICSLNDLVEGKESIVTGTVFRKMELQPSILKDITAEEGVLPLPPSSKYADEADEIILEDEQQRVVLSGHVDLRSYVTGTLIALRGMEVEGGRFEVHDYCLTGLPHQPSPTLDQCLLDGEDRYIIFVSGLGIGGAHTNLLSLQMLIDLVTGRLGSDEDQRLFSKVVRFVIAGNSLSDETQSKDTNKVAKYLTKNAQAKSVGAVKSLDEFLVQLGCCIPVDIMPGEFDPTGQFLPQQPLHKCMFPRAHAYPTVRSTTNPYEADVAGLRILGTSGQNINNIYQYSLHENHLDIMESTLQSGHIAPTCPDTLSCFPYYKNDPFILRQCPHVYFAGNQRDYDTRHIKGEDSQTVLLVSLPVFSETATAAMVNLRDMSCQPLRLRTSLNQGEKVMGASSEEMEH